MATRHQADLLVCGNLPGVHVGRVGEAYDGICVAEGCDSFVRPCVKAYICDQCFNGPKKDRCIISNAPAIADAYYCEECVQLGKDRDGCPCVINIGNLQKANNNLKRKANQTS